MLLQIQSSTSVTAVLPDKFVANENLQHLRVDSPKLTLQTVSVCGFAKTWVMCLGRNGACCYKLQIQSSTSVTVTAVLPAKFNEDLQHLRVDSPKLTLQTVSVCGFANDLVMVVSKSKGERNEACCKAQSTFQRLWLW